MCSFVYNGCCRVVSNHATWCKKIKASLAKLLSIHSQTKWLQLYVIIMSRTSFRLNPHSIVCLNVKGLLAWSERHIWSLSDSNEIQTYNHLIGNQTLNHQAKLAKWLSCVVRTYLYSAFDCMLLCQVRVWIHSEIHHTVQLNHLAIFIVMLSR